MTRLLCATCTLLLLLAADPADARRWMINSSGALLHAPAQAKSQAFCQANPDALLVFDASVQTPVPGSSGVEETGGGQILLSADVTVEAVCISGPSTLRLRFGALPGSTASAGSDFQPFTLAAASPPLATFAPVTSFGGSAVLTILDDSIEEEDEVIAIGLIGGEVLGPLNVIDIAGGNAPLATVLIEDDDGLDLSQPGVTDSVTDGLGGGADPVAAAAVVPLAENCSTATDQAIRDQCAAIIALAEAGQANALVQVLGAISGEELSAQITSSIDGANQRGSQIDGRIAALRNGATGISLDDVAFNYDGQQIPLGMMFNALAAAAEAPADEGFGGGLLDQRLGAFLNVTRIGGERDAGAFEVGFEFDGYSVLGGMDWRFSDTFIAGAAVGWSRLDSDLDDDGGGLDTRGFSLTGYATWLVSDTAYLDLAVARLNNDYEQRRVVDLSLLGQGFGRSTAAGDTDAAQTSISIGGGWDVPLGEWVWSPRGSLLWSSTDIDGFTENGAGINDLIFSDQEFDSLLWTFSQSFSRSFSISSGALQPYFSLDLSRETRNEAFSISPVLRVRPEQRSTPIFIDESDRNFGRGEFGVSFIGSRGFQWFASYSQLLGYDKVDAWALRGGLRFEF
jgi:uncharacterized protein YhjY with autotransporter beta-barrel domain